MHTRASLVALVVVGLFGVSLADGPKRKSRQTDDPSAPGEGTKWKSLEDFSNFNGNNVEPKSECNPDLAIEIDDPAFRDGYSSVAISTKNDNGYTWPKAGHDAIDICMYALDAEERLCEAHKKEVRGAVHRIRCTLGTRGIKQSLDDGTWNLSYTWWTTDLDMWGIEDKLASTIGVKPPKRGKLDVYKPDPACTNQSECSGNRSCWASKTSHGPRCQLDTSHEGGGDDGNADESASNTPSKSAEKGSSKKKDHGEKCSQSPDCGRDLWCRSPKKSSQKVCMYKGEE